MLQQTQAPRVLGKYREFLSRFPTIRSLAAAPLRDVLEAWSGLGYNRRALYLHRAARIIVDTYHGRVPRSVRALSALPGIGEATAKAVAVYAFNEPEAYVETNIRAVFIHHFFPGRKAVSDRQLLPVVAAALDQKDPRKWYSALMDYGAMLKQRHGNPARRSVHHQRQSIFEGSNRQARGLILKLLGAGPLTAVAIEKQTGLTSEQVAKNLLTMPREGLIAKSGLRYWLGGKP
jgi:A/G-specific adenine glycosylase